MYEEGVVIGHPDVVDGGDREGAGAIGECEADIRPRQRITPVPEVLTKAASFRIDHGGGVLARLHSCVLRAATERKLRKVER